ncbi:MAG: PQQ-binding-like beta-propeller repeat protein [Bryobacterales bacterium]|nr:PQQ-binding-like beta-propeller repeat protein [Bryobacterales bacterium]
MRNAQMELGSKQGVRLWPGVVAVLLQWLWRYGTPAVLPNASEIAVMGGMGFSLLVLAWWLFFSRIPWAHRFAGLAFLGLAFLTTPRILHPSITNGFRGHMFILYSIPAFCLALVAWAWISGRLTPGMRLPVLAGAILAAGGSFALLRTDGVSGDGRSQLAWRWTPTAEQTLLRTRTIPETAPSVTTPAETPAAPPPAAEKPAIAAPVVVPPVKETIAAKPAPPPAWPGFRGANRDSRAQAVPIKTDWSATPPVELWRGKIGPGWSSFAVGDGMLYTQEQNGDHELVTCYAAATGQRIWTHRDTARFWESNGGAGPRATPTIHNGIVYAHGGTGILNALDARTGAVKWTRNTSKDTGVKVPEWGISGSPLIHGDRVFVAVSGRITAYDIQTGEMQWQGPSLRGSYGSPQLATLGGVPQILLLTGAGAISVSPADGSLLWKHDWEGAPMLQPAILGDDTVLITTSGMSGGAGTRRLALQHSGGKWTVEDRWTSQGLKPYFSDFVVHNGHAYGFDGSILSCIDLQDGKRKWKGGRYGHGQMVLLANQDLLLVLSEEGELVLVSATPGEFKEISKFPVLQGKTWNHPVIVGDTAYVRNGEEMAAVRLPSERD